MIQLPPPNYEQTIEAIVRCDIPRVNIRIGYDEELQSDEIVISDLGKISEEKLRCLKSAVHPFYILTISHANQQAAFNEFSNKEDEPLWRAKSQDWLRARGLLAKVPSFDSDRGVEAFAGDLESACGLKVGSVLSFSGPRSITLRPEFAASSSYDSLGKAVECLMAMFTASNAHEHNIRFSFIGNEAIGESNDN